MAAVEGDDADVFGYHYENHMLAVNLFHMRGGKIVDRREYFWEDLGELKANVASRSGEFFSALSEAGLPRLSYVPHDDLHSRGFRRPRDAGRSACPKTQKAQVQIQYRSAATSAPWSTSSDNNAKQSLRSALPRDEADAQSHSEALQDVLMLAGTTEANRVLRHLAHPGRGDRRFDGGVGRRQDEEVGLSQVHHPDVTGVDDFASMREVVTRRYTRLQEEEQPMPSLMLIDGGIGQLHAAAEALEAIGIVNQPLASIAKREEIIYIYGQEDEPVVLDRHSPVLHLVQLIRDEAHRFAVTFHRKRREIRDRSSELQDIPGVGELTVKRLLQHFGSLRAVQQANFAALTSVVTNKQAGSDFGILQKRREGAIVNNFRKRKGAQLEVSTANCTPSR